MSIETPSSAHRSRLNTAAAPEGVPAACPGGSLVSRSGAAGSAAQRHRLLDAHGRCSCRLALYCPRVVDIELYMFAGKGRHGHLRRALRRVKAMPCALRNDGDRSSAKLEELGRPVIAHDFEGH